MQFKSLFGASRLWLPAVAILVSAGCASTGGNGSDGAPGNAKASEPLVDPEIYNLQKLAAAWTEKGLQATVEADKVVTRFEDIGVVVLSLPLPDSGVIRMFTIWLKDPEIELTVEWLFKVNLQNRDRIVKVYLDEDDDVVTEWYVDVHPGLRHGDIVEAGRIFAVRSLAVARDISDFLK